MFSIRQGMNPRKRVVAIRVEVAAPLICLAAVSAVAAVAAAAGPIAAERATDILETSLATRFVEPRLQEPPALDPSGRWLAYVVQASAPTSEALDKIEAIAATEREAFLIRRPKSLFLLDVRSGEATKISPSEASGWQPVWSPDGRLLAFYSNSGGGIGLWIYDLSTGRSRHVASRRIAEGFEVAAPAQWSADGGSVYVALTPLASTSTGPAAPTVEVRRSGLERETSSKPVRRVDPGFNRSSPGDLAAVEVDAGEIRVVLGADTDPPPQRPYLSPTGRWLAYSGPPRNNIWLSGGRTPPNRLPRLSADLAVTPSAGGRATEVAADIDVDGLRWHPVRDILVYLQAGAAWVVDFEENVPTEPRRLAPELEPLTGPIAFTRKGSALLLGKLQEGSTEMRALVWIPLDGSPERVIETAPDCLLSHVAVDGRGILWQAEPGAITTVCLDRRSDETVAWRADLAGTGGRELWRRRGRLSLLAPSYAGGGIVGSYESPVHPRDLYWFSQDFSEQRRLTRANLKLENLTSDSIGSIEFFDTQVPTFDGTLISVRTAVIMPKGAVRNGAARGIVCVYPGNDFSESAGLFGAGERCGLPSHVLTARGFVVILPHLLKRPRGTEGNVSQEYADALLPIAYRAGALGYVDAGRLALFGHSQGAYAASAVISETNLFRAAVVASSVAYDLIATWGYMRPGFTVPNIWPITGYLMSGPPWNDLKRYIGNSPYLQADRIDTPILLLVGSEDRFPHDIEAGKFFNALDTYDKTVQLAIYRGEDHYLFRGTQANAHDLWKRMLGFLDRYVPLEPLEPQSAP